MADVSNKDSSILTDANLLQYAKRIDASGISKNRKPGTRQKALISALNEIESLSPKEKLEALKELKGEPDQT
ncbi:MAG: hypothetical protein AAB550_02755 [Patescibacteria group bacterium]